MTIGIVGKPYRHFLQFLHEQYNDVNVVAFQDTNEHFSYPDWIQDVVNVDCSSHTALIENLHALSKPGGQLENLRLDGLEATYEASVLAKVWIGAFFGCPTNSEESALAATDKTLMRRRFTEYDPTITPAFASVRSWSDAQNFAKTHSFPLILKPANLMKSLLVTKSNTLDELQRNFTEAETTLAHLYQQHGVYHREPVMVVEEFLAGPPFSIDAVADSQGAVTCLPPVDLVMARELGINDNYNYSRVLPSTFDAQTAAELQRVAAQGIRALGLKDSAAHVELVLTAGGPKLIEIGARFGGYRPRMYELSFGYNMHQALLDMITGQPVRLEPQKKEFTAVFELFPDKKGAFSHIENFDQLLQLPSYHSHNLAVDPGDEVGLSSQGFKFCCSVFLHHQDQAQFNEDRSFLEDWVRVTLQ